MNFTKILPLIIIFGLITSPAMAEKFYIWTDQGGVVNMTNHPSFAPADMKPKNESSSWPVTRPATVLQPSPAPAAPAQQPSVQMAEGETSPTTPVEQTIQSIENRNDAIKKLQDLIQKLMPGGPPPEPSRPDATK